MLRKQKTRQKWQIHKQTIVLLKETFLLYIYIYVKCSYVF